MPNPVYDLDLRIRGRERRLWVLAAVYLLVPVVITILALWVASLANPFPETGLFISGFTIFGHGFFLTILASLSAAERISREREQRTLPSLVNTPLTPARIADGKLRGAWTFTVWLATISFPLLAIATLWGGVPGPMLLVCWLFNLLSACTAASLSLGLSGLFGRSLSAYLAAGSVLFVWYVVTPIIGLLVASLPFLETADGPPWYIMALFFDHLPFLPTAYFFVDDFAGEEVFRLVPVLGPVIWLLLIALGRHLAITGLKREVS